MKIVNLTLRRVQIPMRNPFVHSSASRKSTDNVVCVITLDSGIRGFGEGVPRKYVTGETVESVCETLASAAPSMRDPFTAPSMTDALRYADEILAGIVDSSSKINNAARCALEIAILDAIGNALGASIGDVLSGYVGARPGSVCRHSFVPDQQAASDMSRLTALRDRYRYGAVKLKVGFGDDEDLAAIRRIREVFGSDVDIRVDANRAWSAEQAISFMRKARELGVRAVEDPVVGDTVEDQAVALRALRADGVEVILDEAIRTQAEATRAAQLQALDVVNIRVSKNGGLIASTRMAAAAQQAGVAIQVGCQVGETAILSAAGRILANAAGPVRYYEGSNEYLKYEPSHYVSEEDLTYDGDARSQPMRGPGLGLHVLSERLESFSTNVTSIDV